MKLISSIFSRYEDLIQDVVREMETYFGTIDWMSERLKFDRTRYYEREMGCPLLRRFISFEQLIFPEAIVDVKLITNAIEARYESAAKRDVNIDPGYITLERLVLATGKNYTHRIYLGKGIYADLTLVFHAGTFTPLAWTYPDYADEKVIGIFNRIRKGYFQRLNE